MASSRPSVAGDLHPRIQQAERLVDALHLEPVQQFLARIDVVGKRDGRAREQRAEPRHLHADQVAAECVDLGVQRGNRRAREARSDRARRYGTVRASCRGGRCRRGSGRPRSRARRCPAGTPAAHGAVVPSAGLAGVRGRPEAQHRVACRVMDGDDGRPMLASTRSWGRRRSARRRLRTRCPPGGRPTPVLPSRQARARPSTSRARSPGRRTCPGRTPGPRAGGCGRGTRPQSG